MADETPNLGSLTVSGQEQLGANTDESPATDNADDFDPFSGEMEDVQVDIALAAPPEKEWYHGRLDRQTAEDRLRVAGDLSCYLIRESDRKPGSYVLSYYGKTGISHFKITALCGDFYIGGRQFDSLSDLIGYYTSFTDLLKSERLITAVSPPEPVDDRRKVIATLPYKKIPDTDELSFEKGDVFIVHNDLGDGWFWVTNQQTNESGIVYAGLVKDLDGASVESLPFYHDSISKNEAAELLTKAGPGSFLVRNSDNSPGDYSLFFYCQKTIQRFRIQRKGRQYLMGGRYFDRLDSIIDRYKREQIFNGCTLGEPVFRPRHDFPLEDEPDHEKNRVIYATMQQSSGSDFMRLRSDNITIKGYLSKKSEKTKRWKTMYFMLNGTETQLLYFEDVKRSKPKGLVDLSYSALYPVHDSFFNRPYCFQLAVKALGHFQVFYLSAEDADSMQEWINHLKVFCTNTQPKRQRHKSGCLLKELNSFNLSVLDARKLPSKHIPHAYCVISINDIQVARTQVKDTPDPVWEEDFLLEDLSSDIDKVVLTFYNKTKRSRDPELLQYTLHFDDLTVGQEIEEWVQLNPLLQTIKGDVGSVRLKAKFMQEVIMPLQEYTGLKQVIMAKDLSAVGALGTLCGSERIPLAQALLRIFRQEHQEALLLTTLNELEILKEESASQLFRATSLATTLMDQYMKMTSAEFVHKALSDPVLRIVESKQCCELNPAMLGNPADVEINKAHLLSLLSDVTESIFNSTGYCPMVLRYVCWCLQKNVMTKWPDSETVKTRVVSGFLFLRLLCPAILNPKMFNLVQEIPAVAQRSLKLVAKALQNLANLAESKEPYMEVVNPFIREHKQRMIDFLDKLSNVPECPMLSPPAVNHEVARDLAKIHQFCECKLSQLHNLTSTQPMLRDLVVVTEMVTNHVKHYKGESHGSHSVRELT